MDTQSSALLVCSGASADEAATTEAKIRAAGFARVDVSCSFLCALEAIDSDVRDKGCVAHARIFCDVGAWEDSAVTFLRTLFSTGWPVSIVLIAEPAACNSSPRARAAAALLSSSTGIDGMLSRDASALEFADLAWSGLQGTAGRSLFASAPVGPMLTRCGSDRSEARISPRGVEGSGAFSRERARHGDVMPGEQMETHAIVMGCALLLERLLAEGGGADAAVGAAAGGGGSGIALKARCSRCSTDSSCNAFFTSRVDDSPRGAPYLSDESDAEDGGYCESARSHASSSASCASGSDASASAADGPTSPSAEAVYRFLLELQPQLQLGNSLLVVVAVYLQRLCATLGASSLRARWREHVVGVALVGIKAHSDAPPTLGALSSRLAIWNCDAQQLRQLEATVLRGLRWHTLVRASQYEGTRMHLRVLHERNALPARTRQRA